MISRVSGNLVAAGGWWDKTVNYEIIQGNAIWRFAVVLIVILVAMAAGRIAQFAINSYALKKDNPGAYNVPRFYTCRIDYLWWQENSDNIH